MRGVLHRVADLDDETLGRWRRLAARALEPNPFFAPQMAVPAARHLAGGDTDLLLAVHDGDELALALPVRLVSRYRRAAVPTAVGWGHRHCYLGTPLLAAGDPVRALSAALDALRRAGVRLLVLEQATADGPVRRSLEAALGRPPGSVLGYERPVVRRRAQPTSLDGGLSSSRRKRLRRQRRGLEGELGGAAATRDVAGDDLEEALGRFLTIERSGWKGDAGTALDCHPEESRFFRATMAAFAAEGRAQLWALQAGEVTVAGLCAVEDGGGVFHLKIAHDDAYRRFSPGMLLEVDVLEAFHPAGRSAWIDSCTTADPSPSSLLYPDRQRIETLLVPLGGARAAAAAGALRLGFGLRTWISSRR